MVYVQDEEDAECARHGPAVDTFLPEQVHEILDHAEFGFTRDFWQAPSAAQAEDGRHQFGHARDQVEPIRAHIAGGLSHAEGLNADRQPIHRMARARRQGFEYAQGPGRHARSALGEFMAKILAFLPVGQPLLKEQEDDILGIHFRKVSHRIPTVVNPLLRVDE